MRFSHTYHYALAPKVAERLNEYQKEHATLTKILSAAYNPETEKRIAHISPLVSLFNAYQSSLAAQLDLKPMTEIPDLQSIAQEEMAELVAESESLTEQIYAKLIPSNPYQENACMIEIHPGIGGSEAALFAADLVKMYRTFLLEKKWQHEVVVNSINAAGGLVEAVISVKQNGSYGFFLNEAGVHRVQRVPATESKGRVHTSTAAVVVLPEISSKDFSLDLRDVRIDVMRASGSGGQHVNTTESAVRVVHIPTNTVATCQDERSQHQNKARALEVLRTRLAERERQEKLREKQEQRLSQVSGTERSDRIRTYNYPQNRITDHRSNYSVHDLNKTMQCGYGIDDLNKSVEVANYRDAVEKIKLD